MEIVSLPKPAEDLTGDVTSVGLVTTIAAGSVDVAMLAVGTDGELITWDASGNPAAVAVGTAAHVLTSNGTGAAPTFQAAVGGNLTGPITSVGLATSIAAQTGTGTTFVTQVSPTLTTPNIGTPSAGVATNLTGTAAGLTAGSVTTNANLTGVVTSTGNATAIAAKAIDYTKIADGTDGELLTWDATGVIAKVAVGTATHVLTSNGVGVAPTFQASAAGGISTTLANGNILVGNGSNVATSVSPSGDVDIANDGTFSIASGAVVNADVGGSAAIDYSKLAALSSGNILVGNGSNVATSVNPTGDVDVTNAGVFSIASGVIVDADVNASAAIAISKTALVAGTNITLSTNTLAVDDAFLKNDADDTTTGIITSGGLVLSEAASVSIGTPLLPTTDHTHSGMSAEMLAGGAIGAQDLVCIHTVTQEVVVADASVVGTARAIGIAPAAISDTDTGTVLLQGFIRDDTWAWTTGGALYLSETAGDLTQTAPTTSGAFVQVVGIALSPDVAYINPSLDIIELA